MSLILAAIAPAFIIIIYIYLKDKYEKEPKRILLFSFLLGAIVSVLITTILYLLFDYFLPLTDENSISQLLIKAFLVVALTEEFSKYVIVRYYSQSKKSFNEPFDGIIYAVMVSMGFAVVENLMYVLQGGLEVALVRAFTAIPAHATFGILMGYFMGKAKFNGKRIADNLIGLTLAILFHGIYDFFLFLKFIPGIWIGAFISLSLAIILSRKAIKIHQNNSFFNNNKSE
ncbi:MAG: PrsW family intramembrane metalloprotease [Flavobacteriaceae bacterium]|nr:PrsW family intramembrane metalloprotease [Flavobacteriaceae bacterium]